MGDGTGALCGWEWYTPTILRPGPPARAASRHRLICAIWSAGDTSYAGVAAIDRDRVLVTWYSTPLMLDDPFVSVLVKFEALGDDAYEADEESFSVTGKRTGERITLGDPMMLQIEDVSIDGMCGVY